MNDLLHVVDYPTAQLREHPDNPRTITDQRLDDLVKSLKASPEMMQASPLVALPDGRVIIGNQRLKAARVLGWETIPCVIADLDETQSALWMLRDNSHYGEWDKVALAEILGDLADTDADLGLSGFDDATLDGYLKAASDEEFPWAAAGAGESAEDEIDLSVCRACKRPLDGLDQ